MSAGIPGTSYQGMDYAAAIGAVGGDPVHLLEVMNYVPREQMEEAAALVKAGKVKVEVAQVPQKLYVEVLVTSDGHTGRAVVRDLHTNVVLVEQDGVATLDKQHTDPAAAGDSDVVTPEQIAEFLTVRSIWDYCTEELDPMHDPIDIIRSAVQVNTTISNEGLSKEYGRAIGRNLELNCRKGLMTRDLTTNAMVAASAGADARMAGAPVSVVANSGSGNQGITATMPVVATARWLDIDEEKMLRAVTLSNLIAIRIKAKFGRLSNLCGATVAATGAACGIAYLLGGGYHEVCCTKSTMYRQEEYDNGGKPVYVPEGVNIVSGEVTYDVNGNIVSDTRVYKKNETAVNIQTWAQNYPYRAVVRTEESELFANTFSRSFLKLRRVAVTYDLTKFIQSQFIKGLDVTVFGNNLAVLKKTPYLDPDFGASDGDLQDPSARYVGVSANIKF